MSECIRYAAKDILERGIQADHERKLLIKPFILIGQI